MHKWRTYVNIFKVKNRNNGRINGTKKLNGGINIDMDGSNSHRILTYEKIIGNRTNKNSNSHVVEWWWVIERITQEENTRNENENELPTVKNLRENF